MYTKLHTIQKPIPKTIVKFRNFKKYNAQDFAKEVKDRLQNSDIRTHIQNKNVNKATEGLVNILKNVANNNSQ